MDEHILSKEIIKSHKQIYYPLLAIVCTFFIYWMLSLIIDFADSHTIYPFLFFTLDLLLIKYTIDFYSEKEDKNLNITSKLALFLGLIIILSLITLIGLSLLLASDLFYLIPISVHFTTIFIIYFFLRREVVKYYEKKGEE